ncbi:MAG: hypothetical protein A2W91_20005 [Bacteroidetes bacterium GWF2_38_335]|nr:MAG: hypothetical protein A2W91_20005 [Bacteroidetes bacterium GWF2_38_335]OFY81996.1 MAG: hypothetical protein A2281_09915 [Bacteroidetes bacterium RIFOXYA12_FULL_38_20]
MAIVFFGIAQEKPVVINSQIDNVTVYLSGAQVSRSGSASIQKGFIQLVVEDLPQNINPQSIQVKGKGTFTILSVQHQINYMKAQQKSKEVKMLEDSLKILTQRVENENTMLSVYNEEESMLLANKKLGGEQTGVKTEEIRLAAEFYRTRLTDIKTKQLKIKQTLAEINKDYARISNQLSTLNTRTTQPTSEIVIDISSSAPQVAKFEIDYLSLNAGWTPIYDLRAEDISQPVKLSYKANVYQYSGEEWKNVNLTLCTGNPMMDNNKPLINPWYLNFYYVQAYTRSKGKAEYASPRSEMAKEAKAVGGYDEGEKLLEQPSADYASSYTTVNENTTSVEFKIDIPYSIPTDGKYHAVSMQEYDLKADFRYYAAPKLSTDAFLIALVTGWEQYNLISGDMNIFFEGKYIGKSWLNTINTNDTLEVSLGRDKGIAITRTKLKDFSSKKFIGTNQKESRAWDIEVKNKKKAEISILIEDQMPLSTNSEIEVEKIDISAGKYEEATGKVSWEFKLKPAESKKMGIKYSVKYPRNQTVIID